MTGTATSTASVARAALRRLRRLRPQGNGRIGLLILGLLVCVGSGQAYLQTGGDDRPTTLPVGPRKLYVIALEDDGKLGEKVGCGDSLVAIDLPHAEGTRVSLATAMTALLELENPTSGSLELYNALQPTRLHYKRWKSPGPPGIVSIFLEGQLALGGACDAPRIEAQLEKTAHQFYPPRTKIRFYLNDKPLVLKGP